MEFDTFAEFFPVKYRIKHGPSLRGKDANTAKLVERF